MGSSAVGGSVEDAATPNPNRIGHPGAVAQWESARFTREPAEAGPAPDFRALSLILARVQSPDTLDWARSCRVWGSGSGCCLNQLQPAAGRDPPPPPMATSKCFRVQVFEQPATRALSDFADRHGDQVESIGASVTPASKNLTRSHFDVAIGWRGSVAWPPVGLAVV